MVVVQSLISSYVVRGQSELLAHMGWTINPKKGHLKCLKQKTSGEICGILSCIVFFESLQRQIHEE